MSHEHLRVFRVLKSASPVNIYNYIHNNIYYEKKSSKNSILSDSQIYWTGELRGV